MRLAELLVALCVAVMATSVAAADLLPRPDAAAVKASKAEVRDIFKADYADADLPSEKAKLAREFLRIAADTSKESDRFALLVLARDLAIDGRDRETATAASVAIAERYEPDGPTDGKEQFEKAQGLWSESLKAGSIDKRQLQAIAAEWYAYARPTATGIDKLLIEKRLAAGKATAKETDKDADLKLLVGTWDVRNDKEHWRNAWTFTADGLFYGNTRLRGKWKATSDEIMVLWDENPNAWVKFSRKISREMTGDSWLGLGIIEAKKIK